MSIAKILACLDGSEQDLVTLTTAVRAASPFGAHVVVFFAHPDPADVVSSIAAPLTAEAMRAVIDGRAELQRLAAKRIAAAIEDVCRREGALPVSSPSRDTAVTISFRQAIGYPSRLIAAAASLSDLAVLRPCMKAPAQFETDIEIILTRRRPVLVAAMPPESFRRISVGWDGSVAAAHGISAAIPYLKIATEVELICVQPAGTRDLGTGDVIGYLKAHGVVCREHHLRIDGAAIDRELAQFSRNLRADLLVTGGFGHSRLRETLFGGVTNEFIRNPPLPVLLMH